MTAPAPPGGPVQACVFLLGDQRFAVDVRAAREVVVLDHLTPAPLAPAHLAGVTHLRGAALPVLEIRPLLGKPAAAVGRGARLLVLDAPPLRAEVATDGVLGLRGFDEVRPAAADGAAAGFAAGRLDGEEGPVILLDAPRLLEALRIRAARSPRAVRSAAGS